MTVPFSGLAEPGSTKSGKVGGYNIDNAVITGIRNASRSTGVDFGYLMAQAAQESSFQADAKASTSTATGLYQFLDTTWLSMVHSHGAKYGLSDLAAKIQPDGRGGFAVPDASHRQQILELRKDPKIASAIGAEFALSNKEHLEGELGRAVGSTELYLAHFLGAGGATHFLKAIERNAGQAAADLLPGAAASNRSVFYDRDTGRARTVGEIYKMFAHSIETKQSQFADASVTGSGSTAASGAGGFSSLHGRSFAPPSSTGATTASVGADMPGPTLSLLSILALAALDPPDPVKAINGKTDSQGNRIDNQSQQPQNTPVLDRTQTRSYDRTI